MSKKKTNILLSSGLITAIASSLCCITPLLALIAGTSGAASSVSWMESLRPYFIGVTVVVLIFAWYQKLKPNKNKEVKCNCDEMKERFMQSKLFLGIITIFAALMLMLPYYSSIFYPESNQVATTNSNHLKTVKFEIEGMTCKGCEDHIKHSTSQIEGVFKSEVSYKHQMALIEYDSTKVDSLNIVSAINKTGYRIVNHE